jgi:uncharacterized protein YjbJ (UPF0337 family)
LFRNTVPPQALLRWRWEFFWHRTQSKLERPPDGQRKIVKGSGKQAKRAVKEAVGKLAGDAKLKAEGKTDKTARKAQNAGGRLLRGKQPQGPLAGEH